MTVGTVPVEVSTNGRTVIQNLGDGVGTPDVFVSRSPSPSATAGGRGMKLATGESMQVTAGGPLWLVATAASTDVRVERL